MRFSSEGYEEEEVHLGADEDGKTIQVKLAKLPEVAQDARPDPDLDKNEQIPDSQP